MYEKTCLRRKKLQEPVILEPTHDQEQIPATGKDTNLFKLDIPIALRKGTRSCTKHPISEYLSYGHLSMTMQAFVSHLSSTEIPKKFQEAWKNDQWKKAIMEEMTALEKNGI